MFTPKEIALLLEILDKITVPGLEAKEMVVSIMKKLEKVVVSK